jgi:hypothetical protein
MVASFPSSTSVWATTVENRNELNQSYEFFAVCALAN